MQISLTNVKTNKLFNVSACLLKPRSQSLIDVPDSNSQSSLHNDKWSILLKITPSGLVLKNSEFTTTAMNRQVQSLVQKLFSSSKTAASRQELEYYYSPSLLHAEETGVEELKEIMIKGVIQEASTQLKAEDEVN
ncbi:hypothetical protein Tco_0938194 [Tanacetum coccineum]|uniref:Uncharacterized protein n=1 Tax=Tanacetum coccineum TaxID=301880 RepID=A0ABQ5DH42_9ASTR